MNSTYTTKQKTGKRGFTLIELLVVISIISLLASIVLSSTQVARQNAREVKRTFDIRQIKTALEFYFDDNDDVYPTAGNNQGVTSNLADLDIELAPYIRTIPMDPIYIGTSNYRYVWGKNPMGYGIRIKYEKTGFCKTGVNVKDAWWGLMTPLCSF